MKKLLILLIFFGIFSINSQAKAQMYGAYDGGYGGGYGGGYSGGLGSSVYGSTYGQYNLLKGASTTTKALYGIDTGFNALFTSLDYIQQNKAIKQQMRYERQQAENNLRWHRIQTQGTPFPIASTTPGGGEHSPNITWSDVQRIE